MKVYTNVLRALALSGAILVPVGSFVTRSVVDMPAWQRAGPVAGHIQSASRLRNGEVLYPILGIGSTVLAMTLAVVYRLNRSSPKSAAVPIYLSALFAIGVILATTQAAPQMLSVSHLGNDAVAIQHAPDTFTRWQTIRIACIVFAYVSNLWALLSIVQAADSRQEAN